jgi:DNA-binding CsgD family transcriptional regulator
VVTGAAGENYGYDDFWDEHGVFHYYGAGQVGDMQWLRGNRAIRDHVEDGEQLHVFEQVRPSGLRYVGQFACWGYYELDGVPDAHQSPRQAIIFLLAPLEPRTGLLESGAQSASHGEALFLEDELHAGLRRAGLSEAQADAMAMRLGWDGEGGTTLQIAGDHLGVSRERVRQLEQRIADRLVSSDGGLPLVARGLGVLERIAPIRRQDAAAQLARDGLARGDFDPYGILSAADVLGITTSVRLAEELLLTEQHAIAKPKIAENSRKLVSSNGAGNIGALVDAVALDGVDDDVARRLLELEEELHWLDEEKEWFYLPTARNRAVNQIRKMLSVSPSLTVAEIREGLRRPARPRSVNLPRAVIRALCEGLEWVRVERDLVTRTIDLDFRDVLENTEETLVDVFTKHGPVLDRQHATDLAEEYGLDRTTSYLYLVWSPVLDRIATNRYAIRGADIPAGTLEAMRESHRRRRVQQGHGWTKSGRLWIAYTLSQAVLDTNVVGVPGVLRTELQGKYELQPDNEHLGEVATDGQNLWGLGRLLRRKGAEVGDVLILEFDLVARKCFALVGGPELLEPGNRTDPVLDRSEPSKPDTPEAGTSGALPTHRPAQFHRHDGVEIETDATNVSGAATPSMNETPKPQTVAEATAHDPAGTLVEDLFDELGEATEPRVAGSGSVTKDLTLRDQCVVPGCPRPGKNKLGVRCRVWHEPSPVPGKGKTAALWAPDADAFLCDEHALSGATITLLFEPNTSGTTWIRVLGVPAGDERIRPIKGHDAAGLATLATASSSGAMDDLLERESRLSRREAEVLELAAKGLQTRAIAAALGVKQETVKFHLGNIYRKLGVSSRAQAVRWALSGS